MSPQPHSSLIARWFNLNHSHQKKPSILPKIKLPQPTPGQIILITGPSGSGKSSLLRRFRRRSAIPIINIPRIPLSRRPVIDHFPHISVESALSHLSRVGLAEAHCCLLPPRHLSDGQRWRLRLALALSRVTKNSSSPNLSGMGACPPNGAADIPVRHPPRAEKLRGMGACTQLPVSSPPLHCLLADEFTTLLDPIAAPVVARVLRRSISPHSGFCAILACARHDIIRALSPDLIIRCDFGKLEFWKKTKGESYALQGETSQTLKLHPQPPHPQTRNPRRLQSP
ncbi:MAG TPA: hypothetical protein VGQ99_16580 [Tepidisphaeraceae bacterium]|nr:hypothetical protein [Tepidisphaeraceae bacterium]